MSDVVDDVDELPPSWRGGYESTARLRIEEVGSCLVAAVGGAQRNAARAVAAILPPEDDRISVVMPQVTGAVIPQLVQRLRAWVPTRWESVRLVSARTAAFERGGRPAAQELADGLGVEVIAPDGDVVSVPGGSLFVTTPDGATDFGGGQHGMWWRLRPGRDPQALGRRFPEPEWERQLATVSSSHFGHLAGTLVQEIPSGLWIRRPGKVSPTDLVFAVPIHPTAIALVVSRPGDPPLRTADVRQLIEALPVALRERLVLVPYGDDPVEDAKLGEIGSEAANQTLRVRTGLPLELVGEGRHVVAVRGSDAPAWRPFAVELAWRPYGGARVHSWVPPADNLLPVGPAQLALNDRWLVEVVEAGLWIRQIDRLDDAATVRDLPVQSDYCTVVIGAPDAGQERPPWRVIARLLRELPADARSRLRLVLAEEAGERMARAAAKVQARVVGGHIWLLIRGGRLVPLPRPADYPWPGRHDDSDPFPASPDARGDAVGLLAFVEELRRTPAWDEDYAGAGDDPFDDDPQPDSTDHERLGDSGRPDVAPGAQPVQPQPPAAQPVQPQPNPWKEFDRPVTVPLVDRPVRGVEGAGSSTPPSGRRREVETQQSVLPRTSWPGDAL